MTATQRPTILIYARIIIIAPLAPTTANRCSVHFPRPTQYPPLSSLFVVQCSQHAPKHAGPGEVPCRVHSPVRLAGKTHRSPGCAREAATRSPPPCAACGGRQRWWRVRDPPRRATALAPTHTALDGAVPLAWVPCHDGDTQITELPCCPGARTARATFPP